MGANIVLNYMAIYNEDEWSGNIVVGEDRSSEPQFCENPRIMAAISVCNGYDGSLAMQYFPTHAPLYNRLISMKLTSVVKRCVLPWSILDDSDDCSDTKKRSRIRALI